MKDFWDIQNGKRMWQVCEYFTFDYHNVNSKSISASDERIKIIIEKRIMEEWDRKCLFKKNLYDRYLRGEISCYLSIKQNAITKEKLLIYNFFIPDFDDHPEKYS